MEREIKNVLCLAHQVEYFSHNFAKHWNLHLTTDANVAMNKYSGNRDPLIVFGGHMHSSEQLRKVVRAHIGPQIFLFTGLGDLKEPNIKYIRERHWSGRPTYVIVQDPKSLGALKERGMLHRELYIPLKDYSAYKPTKTGNKIFFHGGWPRLNTKINSRRRLGWDKLCAPLQEIYGDRILYVDPNGGPLNSTQMIELYSQCFVYLKPNTFGGATTMWELGYMGRRTISPGHVNLPHVIQSADDILYGGHLDDLIKLIEEESKHIGKIQYDVAESVKSCHIQDDSWLTLDFWNNWNNLKK